MELICNGCSCLCDDVEIIGNEIAHACRKGAEFIRRYKTNRLASPTINGERVELDYAVKSAAEIIKKAKNPAVLGMGSSMLDAQRSAVELGEKIKATVDDFSTHAGVCRGILEREIKTCTLDEVKDNADVIVYWASDASNSHPRHLSRFTYLPRGKNRQKGFEERDAICIDVRESSTIEVCRQFHIIPPMKDGELMKCIMEALDGKVPKSSFLGSKEIIELSNKLKKAEYGVIFTGAGLDGSARVNELKEFMNKLNAVSNFHMIPMAEQCNTRGFSQVLHERKYERTSFKEALAKGKIDAALVLCFDPISEMPLSLSRSLSKIQTVVIDSYKTPMTELSKVAIPCAVNGIEAGGEVIRMDGVKFGINKIYEKDGSIEEKEIMKMLMDLI